MPGICGIIQRCSRQVDEPAAGRMASRMTHHAGAVHGVLCEPRFGLSAGWAAHQGSFASRMPLWNGRRDVCLILAGEVFDPDTLTPGGEQRLLELYDSQGAAFVRALNGWFAGLLIDFRSENVLLFNDRYGMARVYVHETDDSLYVASEAKCLLGELPHLRKLDSRGLAEWLTCGCVLEGRTLFSGISLLPPGSLWRIGPDGKVGKERYFDPREWEEQPKLEPEDYYAGLQERFRRVLPRYFGGPQRIGISLTGGVDSRLIMAWHPVSAGNPPCYSFGGPFRDCLDVTIGRQVAHACGHSHQVIRVDQQFLEQFPALAARAAYVSDGAMDVTGAVELFVNAAAREIAPVRLTGNYGGEILRSMVAFGPRAISPLPFAPELRQEFARAAETYRRQRDGNPLTFIAFKQVPWHHHSRLSVEQSQLTLRSPFLDNELVAHVYRAPSASVAGKSVSLRLIQNGNPALGGIPTDRGLRLSGASVLDSAKRRWLDLITKAEYAFDYGMPQWFARINRVFELLRLDRAVLGWNKFYHFRYWYRHALGDFLRGVLLSPKTLQRTHFDGSGLQNIVNDHIESRGNYTVELNRILALELMQRQLLDPAVEETISTPVPRASLAAAR